MTSTSTTVERSDLDAFAGVVGGTSCFRGGRAGAIGLVPSILVTFLGTPNILARSAWPEKVHVAELDMDHVGYSS